MLKKAGSVEVVINCFGNFAFIPNAENKNVDEMVRGNMRSNEFITQAQGVLGQMKGTTDYQKKQALDSWAASGFKPDFQPAAREATTSASHVEGQSPFDPPPEKE